MNAVQNLKQSETRLVAAIESITAEVEGIGTGRVEGALAGLETAVAAARARLEAALAFMDSKLSSLTAECNEIAAGIEQDITTSEPMPSKPAAVPQDTPAAAEAANVPPAASTQPEGTQEPQKGSAATADGIDLSEAADVASLTAGAAVPVNRVADLIGAEPGTNGTGHKPGGKGRGRKGKSK